MSSRAGCHGSIRAKNGYWIPVSRYLRHLDHAWKGFPSYSLVILAALQAVPVDLADAARVDGANRVQAFFAVTLPCITPTLLLLTVLAAIFSFKQFTII